LLKSCTVEKKRKAVQLKRKEKLYRRKGKERKGKERKGKEKERKDYAFRSQFNETPSIIPGCPEKCLLF